MPEFHCPRCNATLREEDAIGWDVRNDPAWDRHQDFVVRFACWMCSWSAEWEIKVAGVLA